MRSSLLVLVVVAIPSLGDALVPPIMFVRGEVNADGEMNIADPVYMLNFLFLGGPPPPCSDAGDANDDGVLNIADPVYTLNFLFLGGPSPPAPSLVCGSDPSPDDLPCEDPSSCWE